LTVIEKKRQQK